MPVLIWVRRLPFLRACRARRRPTEELSIDADFKTQRRAFRNCQPPSAITNCGRLGSAFQMHASSVGLNSIARLRVGAGRGAIRVRILALDPVRGAPLG